MKKTVLLFITIITTVSFLVVSCNKKDQDPRPDESEYTNVATDQNRVQRESDDVADITDEVMASSALARVDAVNAIEICGAAAVVENKKITITFDGSECNSRKREGVIVMELTNKDRWSEEGAVVTINFTNYKVTRISDGKSIVLNGSKSITNVKGGLVKNLQVNDTIVHTIMSTSGLEITFDDGTKRTWYTNRTRSITKGILGEYSGKVQGNQSHLGDGNVAFWGINRNGKEFRTIISTPVVWKGCSSNPKVIAGVTVHKSTLLAVQVTYGVKQDGSMDGTCDAYGYQLSWVGIDGKAKQVVVQY